MLYTANRKSHLSQNCCQVDVLTDNWSWTDISIATRTSVVVYRTQGVAAATLDNLANTRGIILGRRPTWWPNNSQPPQSLRPWRIKKFFEGWWWNTMCVSLVVTYRKFTYMNYARVLYAKKRLTKIMRPIGREVSPFESATESSRQNRAQSV